MKSSVEKYIKFFNLERERNYDNRAVVGGLDKISPLLKSEASELGIPAERAQKISSLIDSYLNQDLDGRKSIIHELISLMLYPENTNSIEGTAFKAQPQTKSGEEFGAFNQPKSKNIPPQIPGNSQKYPSDGLNALVSVLPGIGAQNAQKLNTLGIHTLRDLLHYYPRRYDDYSQLKPINRLKYGVEVTIIASLLSIDTRQIRGGKLKLTEAVVGDGTGFIRLTWFNQPWIGNQLKKDDQLVIAGKIDMHLGRLTISNPDWEYLEQDHLHTNRIVPVYSLTSRITQKVLRRLMYQIIGFWAPRIPDFLAQNIIQRTGLLPLSEALSNIHFPKNQDLLKRSQNRLAFNEILLLQLGVLNQKMQWQRETARIFTPDLSWLDKFIQRLPFQLTSAQNKTLSMIISDLSSGHPMNRLLQGDVGSGKTIVAALGAAIVAKCDAQAAFMAPTSILAEQHYRTLQKLLSDASGADSPSPYTPHQIVLLVGDTSEKEKEAIRQGLRSGDIKFVIGTHALIEDPIEFSDLQYIVIDEQHRFGVSQRALLRNKGNNPHLLVMTATPIPRSLALTLYGDLDISIMDELPEGRIPVITNVLHPLERERAYRMIRSEVDNGHQAFIIYPLISQGDSDDSAAAVEEHTRLKNEVFPDLELGLLHGRMKPDDKDLTMLEFRNGKYHILVSTSVIEVGVDIPNATIIMIEGANRFGLAQLHQFRGRVGRSDAQSYCLLVPQSEDALENERLMVMTETNDGFILAEKDLEQRGPGDFLGTRQAGFAELRMAKITDIRLIELAREQAKEIFSNDPDLANPENRDLSQMVNRFWSGGYGDIS